MTLAISTRWNAFRHKTGEAMLDEIISLGFTHVELGFDLTPDLVPGVRKFVAQKAITVDSVHNYCPVPMGVPYPHPEIFTPASLDRRIRESAVLNTIRTCDFAAEIGATYVVVHAGNVEMKKMTPDLIALCEDGRQYDEKYEKIKLKLMMQRDKYAGDHIEVLKQSLEQILPNLENGAVKIALENLPTWEAIPTESEMEDLLRHFDSPSLCCWFDTGHAKIREQLGFISMNRWFQKLLPFIKGMHIHDVLPPARDHLPPAKGNIDFGYFKEKANSGIVLVLEPAPGTPAADIKEAASFLAKEWEHKAQADGGRK